MNGSGIWPKWIVFGSLCLSGCFGDGPDLIDVSGTVTMDGEPLPYASVQFIPEGKDDQQVRPSYGRTDQSGHYTLEYSISRSGVRPGSYRVSISSYAEADEDQHGNPIPPSDETVPAVYNRNTTLIVEVSRDNRQIDFDLDSNAGEIIQPRPTDAW